MSERGGEAPRLEVRGVSKRFPGVQALDGVELDVRAGEVLAVVGANGAGKSTLMKVLAGIERPDAGTLRVDGAEVRIGSARRARELGIALIHQELCLADNLSAGANVYLGREPRRLGFVDHGAIRAGAGEVLARMGADFGPDARVAALSIGRQQSVEIAKALAQDARILILDEPTSSLTLAESENLFEVLRGLRARGVAIVYISHRLGEVVELADRVEVLRDGRNAGRLAREEISHDAMVRLMVGREVHVEHRPSAAGEALLAVEGLVVPGRPGCTLDFEVRAGEKVGLAGLVGAGRTELLETLFGVTPPLAGRVSVDGQTLELLHPRDAIAARVGLVPEDRKQHGLLLEMSVAQNVSIASLRGRTWLDHAGESNLAREMIASLGIAASGPEQLAGLLSGGNQQKVVLARWLALRPRLLLLDEPTRGIDVGARQEIYALMDRLTADGVGILFASSEMEEVLALSDRALVLHEGRLAGELGRAELCEESVMRLATGADLARSA